MSLPVAMRSAPILDGVGTFYLDNNATGTVAVMSQFVFYYMDAAFQQIVFWAALSNKSTTLASTDGLTYQLFIENVGSYLSFSCEF